jgi:hypothetical protein
MVWNPCSSSYFYIITKKEKDERMWHSKDVQRCLGSCQVPMGKVYGRSCGEYSHGVLQGMLSGWSLKKFLNHKLDNLQKHANLLI